jgi:ribonuclease T2
MQRSRMYLQPTSAGRACFHKNVIVGIAFSDEEKIARQPKAQAVPVTPGPLALRKLPRNGPSSVLIEMPSNLFACPMPSKRGMTRITAAALLLGVVLVIDGCRTVPAPQPAQTSDRETHPVNEGEYDRTYQAESRHRHHRSKRNDASDDNWTGYDRADDSPSSNADSGGLLPAQNDRRNTDGNDSRAMRSSHRHNSRALSAAPGQFDFYILNLSWSPEFCHGHPSASECAQRRAFTLHGLWPQNNDGTYPEDCSEGSGPARPSQYEDIYPDASLLQHEWQTHGTCSGLSPDAFFALARRAEQSIAIPAELSHLNQQVTLTPSQIITAFAQSNPVIPAASLAISCGNNYLTAVEVCMDKNLKPESCGAVKTCGASQIRIPAPE